MLAEPLDGVVIPEWGGRRAQQYTAECLRIHGTTCHICGLPGANSADHLVPKSIDPSLTWSMDNLRPAHKACNSSKGNRRSDDLAGIIENGMGFFILE